MPKPMHPRLVAAYQNIKNVTGLEFDENNLDEVKKALGKIYINGTGLLAGSRFEEIKSVTDPIVSGISSTINSALNTRTIAHDVISIMDPNDPYAVPRVIYQDAPHDRYGKVIENPTKADLTNLEKWNEEARAYEKDFRKNHRKNLNKLAKDLETYKMPDSKYLDASYYFAPEQLDQRTGGFQTQSDIWEFSRTENAVSFCNLVLMGRGYTDKELMRNNEDVMEAKRLVGAELTAIMSPGLSTEERSQRFRGLVKDSMDALNGLSFRNVDLSDDKTFDNVKYNQWIANMADNLGQVLKGAEQTFQSKWIRDTEKDLDMIRNFTTGITTMDRKRLQGVNGELKDAESMREPALAQLLVNKAGTAYTKYHNTRFDLAKGEFNLATELADTMKEQIRGNADYADAARRDRKAKNTENYQRFVEIDLERAGNGPIEKLREDMTRAASVNPEDLKYRGRVFAWADADPGVTIESMAGELHKLISTGVATQVSRQCTIEAMFLAYGLMKAEQNGEKISIRELYNNAELQKKIGKEAMQYFREHPMPDNTEKLTQQNYKTFSEMLAALNRELSNTVLLDYDYTNSEEAEAHRDYIDRLQGLLCDSHQLRDVIPEDSIDIFYDAHGGRDSYEDLQKQITLAEAMASSLTKLIPERELGTRSLNRLFEPGKADAACRGLYILKQAEKFHGMKIGEFPADNTGKRLWLTMYNAAPLMIDGFKEKLKNNDNKKAIREYLRSYGRNDAAGIDELIKGSAEIVFMSEDDLRNEKRNDSIVEMGDPGDDIEELIGDLWEDDIEAVQGEDVAHEDDIEAVQGEDAIHREHIEAQGVEPAAEAEQMGDADERDVREQNDSYDWSAELPPTQWKERLSNFYKELDDHDPAWIHSSDEFRDVKHNLKKALDMFEDKSYAREAFNSRMEKLFGRAGDYIDKKSSGKVGKRYGKERLTTITELRDLLAGRNKNPLDLKGVADIFGGKDTRSVLGEEKIVEDNASRQEKLERGMMRLGIYLASAENDNPEKVKGKMELVERVIAERGKNPETRNRLMDEMAKIRPYGDAMELMDQAKDCIISRMMSQKGLDRQAAGWGQILKALETTVQNSQDPAIREVAIVTKDRDYLGEIGNYLRLKKFADKAQEAQNRILDSEKADSLSREEAGAIAATATISSFMKHNTADNRVMLHFNRFILGKSDDQLMEHFAAGRESQALQKLQTNQELRKQAAGAMSLELIGNAGVKDICQRMIAKENGQENAPAKVAGHQMGNAL